MRVRTRLAHREGSPTDAIADLGDGLVIRRARREDAAAVAALLVAAHGATGNAAESVASWAHDLMERPHPTMAISDVLIVEDVGTGSFVSTLNVIPQRWTYGGVPFGVGRVELVATRPDFQGCGLVRHQFDVLHRWGVERGHLLHAISGIPYFYHQFGYEYALALRGGRHGDAVAVSPLPPDMVEPFRVRPAVASDLPDVVRLDHQACARSLVSCVRDEAAWRYELDGRSASSMVHSTVLVLEMDVEGGVPHRRVVGFAVLDSGGYPGMPPGGPVARVWRFEVGDGVSWYDATQSLLRYLTGKAHAAGPEATALRACDEVHVLLGDDHPAFLAAAAVLKGPLPPMAWYIRAPDLPSLVRHVAPVLEARLAASLVAGFSGQILVSFFRSGLRLSLDRGRVKVEELSRVDYRLADAYFPGLIFLQLLMGYRSLEELESAFPDCKGPRSEASRLAFGALFPKKPSSVWPIA